MNEQKRGRAISAPQNFRNTWRGTSNVAGAPDFGIKQSSEQTKDAFSQRDIGIQLVRLKESVKRCSNHWDKKFSSAIARTRKDGQQTIFIDQLNSLLSDFENVKKALPPEVLGLTRDGMRNQRDSIEATPSPFSQPSDQHEVAGGFEQFRRYPIEVKPAPLHQEDTGPFKQPKRDQNDHKPDHVWRAEDEATASAVEKGDLLTRDQNLHTYIVEKIDELYDNEWADGMEALEKSGMQESQALKVLLSVFTTSHETCMEIARNNIESLQRQLSYPTNRQESYDDMIRDFPSHVLKQLKDTRRVAAEYQVGIPAIIQEVDKVQAGKHGHHVVQSCRKFIDRCVEYSWYMSIQDPPLEIEYQYTIGGKFEHDKMRAYTLSGKYVEYVVWPAIYLHKGGAMLSKAVVQGRSEAVNARAAYAGPSVMDTFEQTQTIRPISENMSPKNTYRKGDFNKAMIDRSIETESDINSFTKSMGTASGVSSNQREYYDSSRNSRCSPKISTQTVDKPCTYTGDFPRSTTPDQWRRYGTDQISRTGTPTRGKGQSNNSRYPSSKSYGTTHATQISVSHEHYTYMYQQQRDMVNRNLHKGGIMLSKAVVQGQSEAVNASVALISQALSGKNEWENCIISTHGKAEWKCINCGDFYCVECKNHHAMGTKTGLHRLLPFSEKDTEDAVRKEVFCRHHEERELDMFCITDKMPICAQCEAAIEHRGHETTTMVKYAEDTRYEVGSTLTKADKLIPEFENKLEKIAIAKKQIDANDEHVDIIVKETITKLQQTALNLKTVEKKKMKILEKREEKVTKERSSVTLKVLETRKFLENCSKNEIVRQGQGFIEDLEAVIKDSSSESEIQITQLTREEIYQELKKL